MTRGKLKTFSVFVFAGLLGALLLHTSQQVQKREDALRAVFSAIEEEKEKINVLEVEWAYLNRPDYLEVLAGRHLDLVAPGTADMLQDLESIELPGNDVSVMRALPEASSPVFEATPISFSPAVRPPLPPSKPQKALKPSINPTSQSKSDTKKSRFQKLLHSLHEDKAHGGGR